MEFELDRQLQGLMMEDPSHLLFLCGAGISLDAPTSLPTVNTFICSILEQCGTPQKTIDKVYQQFGHINYRFESLIDEIRKTCDGDLKLAKLFSSTTYNKTHSFLATMLQRGATIITTNFDNCIENACMQTPLFPLIQNRVVYTGKDLEDAMQPTEGKLIKIHGSQPLAGECETELVITIKALAKTARAFGTLPNWRQYVLNLIYGKVVVVMGYSCSDDFDVVPLLAGSVPKSIIWLNFDSQKPFPVSAEEISNVKIAKLSEKLPLAYYNGRLVPALTAWSEKMGVLLCDGPKECPFTVSDYMSNFHSTSEKKQILSNEIILSYGLYTDINVSVKCPTVRLQEIKAKFRMGQYGDVIALCEQVLETGIQTKVLMENLYYLSSALYYEGDLLNALKTAKDCVIVGWRAKDLVFYFNALTNYASILYVYASTLPDGEQAPLLLDAERKFRSVMRRTVGINIEAEANALWGLGDLERYRGNIVRAKELLHQALEILQQIGNVYAINQVLDILREIETTGY